MDTVHITEIKQTKKGRYALFCGEEFLFSVDEETFVRHHIVTDMTLSTAQLNEIRESSDNQKALRKALDYLALRDHSGAELKTKLMRSFDAHTAQYALDKVRAYGYIDDVSFARKYAAELIERRGVSLRETAQKLRQKGIDRETADEALAAYDEQDETAGIRQLVEKKYRVKLAAGNRQAVFAALARRGFSARDIRTVLSEYGDTIDEEY